MTDRQDIEVHTNLNLTEEQEDRLKGLLEYLMEGDEECDDSA